MTDPTRYAGKDFPQHPERDPLYDPPEEPAPERVLLADTETTDASETAEIIELALAWWPYLWRRHEGVTVERFQPTKAITAGAMATHHIIPADLVGCRPSADAVLPPDVEYLVGHHIDFDWERLGKPAVKRICTEALARMAWPTLGEYSLGALLYTLDAPEIARHLLRDAHDAGVDVENMARLLQALIHKLQPNSWDHLYQLSEEARIPKYCTFGKHKPQPGEPPKPWDAVPRDYREWILRQPDMDPYVKTAVRRSFGEMGV